MMTVKYVCVIIMLLCRYVKIIVYYYITGESESHAYCLVMHSDN